MEELLNEIIFQNNPLLILFKNYPFVLFSKIVFLTMMSQKNPIQKIFKVLSIPKYRKLFGKKFYEKKFWNFFFDEFKRFSSDQQIL